jgi:succinoglycan biosynthesis transport protein ExoP
VTEASPEPRSDEKPLGWLELVRRSRQFAWIYVVGAGLAVLAGPVAAAVVKPVFTSQTVLLHRELVQPSALGRDAAEESSRQRAARLRDMVLARANLAEVIVALDLYPGERKTGEIQGAIDEFLLGADCKVAEDTFTLKVSYPDPDLAHRAAAALADSLVAAAGRYRKERALATRDFVLAQRDETARELVEREEALAEFLASHPEFAQDPIAPGGMGQAGASVRALQRKAAGGDPTLDALEKQRSEMRRRLHRPAVPSAVPPPPPAPNDSTPPAPRAELLAARRDVERASSELAELRGRFTDAHPDVSAARRKYEAAQRVLLEAESRPSPSSAPSSPSRSLVSIEPEGATSRDDDSARARISSDLRALEDTLTRARRQKVASSQGDSEGIVDLETQWLALNRSLLEARERHEQLERRSFQANIIASVESAGGASPLVVVDPAFRPERPTARRRANVVLTAVVGVLGLTVALALGATALEGARRRRGPLGGSPAGVTEASDEAEGGPPHDAG